MTREQILKLHTMDIIDAAEFLEDTGVLRDGESLANAAFRMRDDVVKTLDTYKEVRWCDVVCDLMDELCPEVQCDKCKRMHSATRRFDWHDEAKPIHWIQAALLAKLEAEK